MSDKFLCPYCSNEFSVKMTEDLSYCEGSYTPDCVLDTLVGNLDVICEHCNKLIYRKEVKINLENISNIRWNK